MLGKLIKETPTEAQAYYTLLVVHNPGLIFIKQATLN